MDGELDDMRGIWLRLLGDTCVRVIIYKVNENVPGICKNLRYSLARLEHQSTPWHPPRTVG